MTSSRLKIASLCAALAVGLICVGLRDVWIAAVVALILVSAVLGVRLGPRLGARPGLVRVLAGVALIVTGAAWMWGGQVFGLGRNDLAALAVGFCFAAFLLPAASSTAFQAYLIKRKHREAELLAAEDAKHAERMRPTQISPNEH